MARPLGKKFDGIVLQVRLSKEERAILEILAKKHGLTLSGYVRGQLIATKK